MLRLGARQACPGLRYAGPWASQPGSAAGYVARPDAQRPVRGRGLWAWRARKVVVARAGSAGGWPWVAGHPEASPSRTRPSVAGRAWRAATPTGTLERGRTRPPVPVAAAAAGPRCRLAWQAATVRGGPSGGRTAGGCRQCATVVAACHYRSHAGWRVSAAGRRRRPSAATAMPPCRASRRRGVCPELREASAWPRAQPAAPRLAVAGSSCASCYLLAPA